MIKHGVKTQA